MPTSILRLLVCFVGVPFLTGLLAFAAQFYVTYVTHDQLSINPAAVLGMAILGFCPAFVIYLVWVVIGLAVGKER